MDSSNLNFDGGSRSMWGVFVMQILIPIYCVLHSWLVHGKKESRDIKRVNGMQGCYFKSLNSFSQVRTQGCLFVTTNKLS